MHQFFKKFLNKNLRKIKYIPFIEILLYMNLDTKKFIQLVKKSLDLETKR